MRKDKEAQKQYAHEYYERVIKERRRKAREEKEPITLICPVCGKEFKALHRNTKMCSDECRKKKELDTMHKFRNTDKYKEWEQEYWKSENFKAVRQRYAEKKKKEANL